MEQDIRNESQLIKRSLKRLCSLFCIVLPILWLPLTIVAQAPVKEWDARFGGTSIDELYALHQLNDGSYILGGKSSSPISGDKTEAGRGYFDYWVVKISSTGTKIWDKRFGGNDDDDFVSIEPTLDGGFILGGTSESAASGDKTEPNFGFRNIWVVKIDSNGTKQWDKRFGSNQSEYFGNVIQTADGGYMVAGSTQSLTPSGNVSQPTNGYTDFWVLKLDSSGTILWDARYGGSGVDNLYSMQSTSDGGYILTGSSSSPISGDKTVGLVGGSSDFDVWMIKIDNAGIKQWDAGFGGDESEFWGEVIPTSDGGYIWMVESESGISGDKTHAAIGDQDYWIIKVNSTGVKEWDATYGTTGWDYPTEILQTPDGGYIVGGYTSSGISGDKTQASIGFSDYWLLKISATGTKQWDAAFGGSSGDELHELIQTSDGGFMVGGLSRSSISGDKSQPTWGGNDFWILKLSQEIIGFDFIDAGLQLVVYPNPAQDRFTLLTDKAFTESVPLNLFNMGGQLVHSQVLPKGSVGGEVVLEKHVPAGLYTLQLNVGGKLYYQKINLGF
jgi:hypothetical protein